MWSPDSPAFVFVLLLMSLAATQKVLKQTLGDSIVYSRGSRPGSKMCSEDINKWQYLSLGNLEQNELFPKINLEVSNLSCALTFNYGHVTKNWKWRKLANWWPIYFVSINKLVFLKGDNRSPSNGLLMINIPNFLRLEWMYAKFKIKVLNNSRLNLGI